MTWKPMREPAVQLQDEIDPDDPDDDDDDWGDADADADDDEDDEDEDEDDEDVETWQVQQAFQHAPSSLDFPFVNCLDWPIFPAHLAGWDGLTGFSRAGHLARSE